MSKDKKNNNPPLPPKGRMAGDEIKGFTNKDLVIWVISMVISISALLISIFH